MNSAPSEIRERVLVGVLCLLGAIHIFVYSAAFPFFNPLDEQFHFDLVIKYSLGHFPRGLEKLSDESMQYSRIYTSPEYLSLPGFFLRGRFPPPPWKNTGEKSIATTTAPQTNSTGGVDWWWYVIKDSKKIWLNYEASQQPLYYLLAGGWWNIGQACGLKGLQLMYWLRFLNVLFVAALVWLGYVAARLVFPENAFLRLGVPALIAFIPQQAFYSIQNDVLSPVCFTLAFIGLVKWLRAESPGPGLGIATGLAMAAAFLVKLSNVPALGVLTLAIFFKIWQLSRTGNLRKSVPGLVALALCAGLPVGGCLVWTKNAFGDFSGTAAKLQAIGWTPKPFVEWWHHPIFTLQGLWTFVSELLVTFWQGEFVWHANPLNLPAVDACYVIPSLFFTALAVVKLLPRFSTVSPQQRRLLWLALGCLLAGMGFLAFLSIRFDFGPCPSPSRDHPYFIAGRLVLGALIPFLLLYLHGLDSLLRQPRNNWLLPVALSSMILFMLVSEIVTDWSVFSSQYNWFHS